MENQAEIIVAVVATGGTIANLGRDSLDLNEYGDFSPMVDVNELISRVPELHTIGKVIGVDFGQLASTRIGPTDWLELLRTVHAVAEEHPTLTGIVVTHGTSTLEETAYFLDLTVKLDIPVVVVGAQRPLKGLSSDAYLNLVSAVRVAANSTCRGLGVVTVFNNEIQAARDVTKTSTHRLEAFQSSEVGMLGYVDLDGSVVVYRKSTRRHAPDTIFDLRGVTELPRVDIVYSYAGGDDAAVRAYLKRGARGIVSAGFAPGQVTPAEWDALLEARSNGVLVVQSTRAASGRVLSRALLREHGIVVADNLNPQKARILTMLALTVTNDVDRIQGFFNEY